MGKVPKYVLAAVVIALAVYGAIKFVETHLDFGHGAKAVETVHPFVKGAVSSTKNVVKDSLIETPDAQLEAEGELFGKKLYPASKGFVRGQWEAFSQDPDKKAIVKKILEAAADLSKDFTAPVTEKIQDSSQSVLQDWTKALQGVKKLRDDNKDLLEGISSGLESLQKKLLEPMQPSGPSRQEP